MGNLSPCSWWSGHLPFRAAFREHTLSHDYRPRDNACHLPISKGKPPQVLTLWRFYAQHTADNGRMGLPRTPKELNGLLIFLSAHAECRNRYPPTAARKERYRSGYWS